MSELNFAKSYLQTLDSKTTKYQSDHVFDPKTFQMRVPFTLPRLSHPPHPLPPKSASAGPPPPGSQPANATATIILRSSRNPVLSLTLPSLPLSTTTITQLKESVQSTLGGPSAVALEKIKILYNKKPIPPSKKTIADAVEDGSLDGQDIELGVMVMGGAADPPPPSPAPEPVAEAAAASAVIPPPSDIPEPVVPMEGIEKVTSPPPPPPAQGPSAKDILATEEFWNDLQGFLEQRLKDQEEAATLRNMLRKAWRVDE